MEYRVENRAMINLAVILGIWVFWLGYQYFTKFPQAYILVQQKMDEIGSMDTDLLVNKIGRFPENNQVVVNNKTYWVSWRVYGNPVWNSNEAIKEVEARGKVYFIQLIPFTEFRLGYGFKVLVRVKTS